MLLDDIHFSQHILVKALSEIGFKSEELGAGFLNNTQHIVDITLDSRCAHSQCAFIAVKGSMADGYNYIESAIKNNCRLVLCERELNSATLALAEKHKCSVLVHSKLRASLATLLTCLFECDAIDITAVTGTNGKTSVTSLVCQLSLASRSLSACLGTLGLSIYGSQNGRVDENTISVGLNSQTTNTTPDIITHYKVLKYLQNQQIEDYSLEASSHGIEQGRLTGLPINIAVLTNLSQDHLDYHGDMQHYAQAKRGLLNFDSLEHIVLNADDKESVQWHQQKAAHVHTTWYSLDTNNLPKQAEHFCLAQALQYTPKGIEFDLRSSWGEARIALPLLGRFNVSNALAALCIRLLKGDSFSTLVQKMQSLKGVAGRMELFVNDSAFANIIVDYAHTPDALSQALLAARQHTSGKLYCVFGCGGNRDKSKRALMGKAASTHSDVVVLTQDNSRNEVPDDIVSDIKRGLLANTETHTELDRKTAIKWALGRSNKADLILLAGKGHETYLEIQDKRIAYDERAFVRSLISEVAA